MNSEHDQFDPACVVCVCVFCVFGGGGFCFCVCVGGGFNTFQTYRIWWRMCCKLLPFSHLQVLRTGILGKNYHFIHRVCESVCFEFSDSVNGKKSDSTVCVPGQCM